MDISGVHLYMHIYMASDVLRAAHQDSSTQLKNNECSNTKRRLMVCFYLKTTGFRIF